MAMHRLLLLTVGALPLLVSTVAAQDYARYREWDRNRDGVISRSEWRGAAQEFRNLDWNRDGVLSGDELGGNWNRPRNEGWESDTFVALDRNNDRQLTRDEWRGDRMLFGRMDRNRDNRISRGEFMNANVAYEDLEITGFNRLDSNRDGRIERREWDGTSRTFDRLDINHDGWLNRRELLMNDIGNAIGEFETLDVNNNGVISRNEWRRPVTAFSQYDRDRDGVISRREYELGEEQGDNRFESHTFRVDARQQWLNTGLYLQPGDVLTVQAAGTIQMSTNDQDRATPSGSLTGRTAPNSPLPQQKAGALLARTTGGELGVVGEGGTFTADRAGGLMLGVNDDYFQDNRGEYRVTVSIRRR